MDEMQDQAPETFHIGAPPAKPRKRRKSGLLIGLGVFALVAVLAGGGVLVWVLLAKTPAGEVVAQVTESPLSAAQRKCVPREAAVKLGDGGKSLSIQTFGKDNLDGISLVDFQCILDELEVTDAIQSEIETTRALDGRQTGDWGDFHASWTYHPDDGMRMVVTMP